ncbi:MAG: DUF2812 domain-containing protein [Clostridia bacterium]|nr:DUF2812 domain-containing protein [Clostridia bacterium]
MARNKKEKNPLVCQKVNYFPGWLSGSEEEYLQKMAQKGWMLKDIHRDTVYHFERCEPRNLTFAVEFLGKHPSIDADIARNCNAGWEYIGNFAKKRYYYCESSSLIPAHPSSDSDFEASRLSTTVTNLTTLLLLNIPGTLYCLMYSVLLVLTNGLSLIGSFSYQFIYLWGTVLGIVSIGIFFRWILTVKRRLKKLNVQG